MNTLSAAFGGFESVLDAPLWVMLLVKATAVLAAAWVAHLALARANPRWRVVLWRATAVGLLALPALAWSLPALTIDVESTNLVGCVKTHHEYTSSQDPWCVQTNPTDVPVGLDKPVQSAGLPPAVTIGDGAASHSPLPNRPSTMTLGLALWISGVALLLLRLALGYVRVRRVVRRTVSAAAAIRRECLRVAHAVGCRTSVEVVQSADVSSPILIGLARPRLLLPARMDEASYRADLPGILAHELAHVRSRDVFWNLAMELISIALWFHPLAWRMRRVHLAACELVSDAVSAGYVGDVARYCRTLARVAVETYRPLPRSGIAMARTSSIGRRLAVLRKRVFHLPLRRPSVVAFTLSAAVAVALVGALQFALAAAPEKGGTSLTAAKGVAEEGATAGLSGSAETKPIESARADKPPVAPAATLRVTVLDPDGKPLPEAKVHASIWTEEKDFKHNRDYMTDAAGVVQVELPKTYSIVRLWASKKPFVTRFVHWEQNELAGVKGLPEETTVQLRPGVTIGGRIVDEQGKPIAGVKVELFSHDAVTTDADGRWQIDCVANDSKKKLLLSVVHPDYVSDERWGELQKEAGITTAMLRDQTATLTMKRGITVQGQVTDPDGKPIKDAIVVEGDNPYDSHNPRKFPTDADGRFRLPALSPRETTLTVIAAGFAPQLRKVNLEADMPPQDFRMARGKPVELRLVDAQGKPFPEINVNIIEWKGSDSIETQHNPNHPKVPDTGIPRRTDKDGIWRWTSAPDDPVKLRIDSYPTKGFAPMEMEVAGGDPPRTVTLKSEHRITGRVTDAATGKPIPAFAIIPINVFRKDWLSASRCNAEQGKDGRLDFLAERTDIPLRLRVEAMGYRTQTGPEFRVGDDSP
ncbi:MAG: carboxypeptidase regulatory-like domain-containing protein, partial [Pirellulales bacterium]|nr:carboxypeptidase regulatory-like domain-containing protein [Pirellulales bacterium]